ncbi:C-C motif chemokine 3-like [Myxocyprinus asiaticus]|uniref:C-C motif chemokine 3-like n=1 Tax=Myxocyprinus asiaticus TaxID=70543 RepID=UPI0022227188|nr:C-C motif chemokine 3-like [Myxocyprinus asiaticus]
MTASRFFIFSTVVVLLAAITLSEGLRIGPKKCCSSFMNRPLPAKLLVDYSMTSQQCPSEAVLFKTVKGRQICARPTESWVQKHIKTIESRRIGGQVNM